MAGVLEIFSFMETKRWQAILPEVEDIVRLAANEAWECFSMQDSAQVCYLLCDDEAARSFNCLHRGQNKPTNVLSISMGEVMEPGGVVHLGDIILASDTVIGEAKRDRKSLSAHVSHMALHGLLHLLGYDHTEKEKASEMEIIEISVLSRLGYPNPYEMMLTAVE